MKNGQGDFMKDIMMRDMKVMKIIFTRDTEISILMQKNVMMNIGFGKRIGLSMKRINYLYNNLIVLFFIICCCACDPDIQEAPCGLYVDIELPRNVDSVHVKICNNDSICTTFRDTIPCLKCSEKKVDFFKSNNELNNNSEWGFGEFFVEEIAYCKGEKTLFSMSFSVQAGKLNDISIRHVYDGDDEYGFSSFVPVDNGCGIDTTYKVRIINNYNCRVE